MSGGQSPVQPSTQSPQSGSDDLLGTLLGGLMSGGQSPAQTPQTGGNDLLGTLLGGLMSGGQPPAQSSNQPGGSLINVLLGALAGGSGSSSLLPALVQAFVGRSDMGQKPYREQSTGLVVDAFLRALSSMSKQ